MFSDKIPNDDAARTLKFLLYFGFPVYDFGLFVLLESGLLPLVCLQIYLYARSRTTVST